MDSMKILSRIYDLLSECTIKDLQQAAKLAGDNTELSDAILKLTAMKRNAARYRSTSGPQRTPKPRSVADDFFKPRTKSGQQLKFTSNGLGKKLSEVVLSKKNFRTNRDLGDYLKKSNIPLRVGVKDSRKRILSKLLNWIGRLPQDQQRSAYIELLRILPRSETSGWFDAIRNSQP